ncbi:MAG: hypothetical protein DDT42_01915 [candidate division WS2 bacterium]|uniref:Uncharacterized protein n=1 Tax=Psychracetigena formicireducens TaxID=2986056 RepID=A0A9E2F5C0_PSYF1|nr:hypothetical protein [Candidatus Psychracetigena formicireducens]
MLKLRVTISVSLLPVITKEISSNSLILARLSLLTLSTKVTSVNPKASLDLIMSLFDLFFKLSAKL